MRPLGVGILKLEITSEIDAALANLVARAVGAYPAHHIELALDAPGGDWAASLAIFTSLKNHGRRVTAHIEKASSGGALVAMACDVRKLQPWGHFFLHRPQGNYPKATLDQIADRKAGLMAGRCRIPASRIRRWMDETTILSAERALAYGLVHEVVGMQKPKNLTVFL